MNLSTVVSPKEKTCYRIALVLALLAWLVLTILTVGMVWLTIGILFLVVWFSNGLLVAGLRGDAVEVHADQLGRLHATLREVCATLGLERIPELYVLQEGGTLNAFATRHTGRHFVVIFSDMLEAFGPDSAEMKFLLGHEIGHIHRRHLGRRLLLAPALFLPILGPAYSRACESTCDRYGALAAADDEASARAMMILAGGKEAGRSMDLAHFAAQNDRRRGFFVSWYELISGYPTLCRRVRDLCALAQGTSVGPAPKRHPLAWLFAFITFGGGFGGRGSILTTLVMLYVVGVFAVMLVPIALGAKKFGNLPSSAAGQPSAVAKADDPSAGPDEEEEESAADERGSHLWIEEVDGWERTDETDSYTFVKGDGPEATLKLMPATAGLYDLKQLSSTLHGRIEELPAGDFEGRAVRSSQVPGRMLVYFVLSAGEEKWNGVFAGKDAEWEDARAMLAGATYED